VLANLGKVRIPKGYKFPPHIMDRPRDFKLSWFLVNEIGVAAIPPSGKTYQYFHALLTAYMWDRILYR
jgi:hypothetical protein